MNLVGHFLISMPAMMDPNFSGTVIYVCEHGEKGALGLVINRPTELSVPRLFEKAEIKLKSDLADPSLYQAPVYFGGPVQTDRGFVLHSPRGEFNSSLNVDDQLALTTSKDVLEALGQGAGPPHVLITLGYSGWGEGQLEREIADNAWLTVKGDARIIFDVPAHERFTQAMLLLGVDPTRIAPGAGHA